MNVSAQGRAAIMQREGCRLRSYQDSVGVWTIGVGHTGRSSPPPVEPGMEISQEQADEFLAADLAPAERAVNRAIHCQMTQNQFDAMVSLSFNIGTHAFETSSVVRLLNEGQTAAAASAFLLWDKPAVLVERRHAERDQFLADGYASV